MNRNSMYYRISNFSLIASVLVFLLGCQSSLSEPANSTYAAELSISEVKGDLRDIERLCDQKRDNVKFDYASSECVCTTPGMAWVVEKTDSGKFRASCKSLKAGKFDSQSTRYFNLQQTFVKADLKYTDSSNEIWSKNFFPHFPIQKHVGNYDVSPGLSIGFKNRHKAAFSTEYTYSNGLVLESNPLVLFDNFSVPRIAPMRPSPHGDEEFTFYEPSDEAFAFAMGSRTTQIHAEYLEMAAPSSENQKIRQIQDMVFNVYNEFKIRDVSDDLIRNGQSVYESDMDLGCLEACRVSVRWQLSSSENSSATYNKNYVRGVRTVESIQINDEALDYPLATIVLNYGGGVSHVLITELRVSEKSVETEVRMYDRHWNSLIDLENEVYTESYDLVLNQKLLKNSARDSAGHYAALICDSSIKPGDAPLLRNIVGPYQSDDPRKPGSLWGWLPNEQGKIRDYFAGVFETSRFFAPGTFSKNLNEHSHDVASVFLGEEAGSLVSYMEIRNCLTRIPEWSDGVFKAGIKVVNVSSSTYLDQKKCQTIEADKKNPELGGKFLWVVAAGNESKSSPDKMHCPQTHVNQPNQITVGALDGDRISTHSNFGTRFVDLLADGRSSFNSNSVTSFAAPRVSQLAAKLAKEFPELTVAEIRWSILLGSSMFWKEVDENPWYYLTKKMVRRYEALLTRTGGYLDEERSQRIAGTIAGLYSSDRSSLNQPSDRIEARLFFLILDSLNLTVGELDAKLAAFSTGGLIRGK